MAAGFGFCANCGTPASAPDEKFCASCGTALPGHAAAAAAAAAPMAAAPMAPPPYSQAPTPPPYGQAPTPPPYAQAPTPPPYGQPPASYAPPPYGAVPPAPGQPAWGAPPMGAYGAPAKSAVNPLFIVVGAVVILAIVGVGAFALANGNKSSGSPGANGRPGTLVFSPTTISCDATLTISTTLPASVKDTDPISLKVDGNTTGTHTAVEAGLTKQADGSWSGSSSGPFDCSTMGPGAHTEQLVDGSGNVLAEGSFIIAGPTATQTAEATAEATAKATARPTVKITPAPTPVPVVTAPPPTTEGSVVVTPNSFSCSGPVIQVSLSVTLPASLTATSTVTAVIDGSVGSTGTVGDNFTRQADGSWLSATTDSSTTLCKNYDTGQHDIGFQDSTGNMVSEGTFTVLP